MAITFGILGIAVVMFIWGRYSLDLIAIGAVLALFLTDIIDVEEALSGFSNPTVILIGALFIVSEGLTRTGITAWFGDRLIRSSKGNATRLLTFTMIGAALMSGVISNTATVAALIPSIVLAAWGVRSMPSRFLIPLAFSSTIGGMLTLTGTAPNLVISEALAAQGEQPFEFFEFSLIGLPLLIVTIAYMLFIGRHLLPSRSKRPPIKLDQEMMQLADAYSLDGDLYRLRVRVGSPLAGSTLRESNLGYRFGVSVLEIHPARLYSSLDQLLPGRMRERLEKIRRDHPDLSNPDQILDHHDVLIVRGTVQQIGQLEIEMGLGVLPIDNAGAELSDLLSQEIGIAEVLLTPRSSYIGVAVAEGGIRQKDIFVIRVRRAEKIVPLTEPLQAGDAMLVRGKWDLISDLANESRDFVIVGQPELLARQVTNLNIKSAIALATLTGMIVLMVAGVFPVVVAALLAVALLIAGGCITSAEAYHSVRWSTIVLIAGMMPMAAALESTGGAQQIADALVDMLGNADPRVLLAGIMLISLTASQSIGNAATAVLLSPIVLSTAIGLGVNPDPLMMGLAVACSTAFIAPIATVPNLLVMSPGNYRFVDYARVGAPLSIIFLIVSVILIPMIWQF